MKVLIPLKNPLELPDITQDPMTVKTFKYVVFQTSESRRPGDHAIAYNGGEIYILKEQTGPIWMWGDQVDQMLPLIENECLNLS